MHVNVFYIVSELFSVAKRVLRCVYVHIIVSSLLCEIRMLFHTALAF